MGRWLEVETLALENWNKEKRINSFDFGGWRSAASPVGRRTSRQTDHRRSSALPPQLSARRRRVSVLLALSAASS